MQSQKPTESKPLTPFQWQRYTAQVAQAVERVRRPRRSEAAAKPRLTAAERAARVLAHRWGNPYCKPGPV